MKKLLLALVLVSAPAFADVSNFSVVKSQDGKTVVCESDSDLGKTGYRPLVTTMQVEGASLKLNTAVASLVCVKKDAKFSFDARHLADPIPGTDLDGAPTTETLSQLKFLVVDRNSQILGQLDAKNDFMQAIEYSFAVESSFPKEDLDRLERGETLHVQWEFFLQGVHSIRRASETIPLGLFTGGSYYLSFDLRQNAGRYEVVNVLLQ
jgi:hypothetical protein